MLKKDRWDAQDLINYDQILAKTAKLQEKLSHSLHAQDDFRLPSLLVTSLGSSVHCSRKLLSLALFVLHVIHRILHLKKTTIPKCQRRFLSCIMAAAMICGTCIDEPGWAQMTLPTCSNREHNASPADEAQTISPPHFPALCRPFLLASNPIPKLKTTKPSKNMHRPIETRSLHLALVVLVS